MRLIRSLATPVLLVLCSMIMVAPAGTWAQSVPTGFTDTLITDAIDAPTALAFLPNGDLLITSKAGMLWFLPNGDDIPTEALDLTASTCSNSERGLLGVALHPAFSRGANWIYLYYTARRSDNVCVNRVSRFQLAGGDVLSGTEQILLDNMRSTAGNHNGGDVQFGKDGHLYVSIGEGGVPANAQKRNLLSGKILRITADGGIPAGNPFRGKGTSRCHRTGQTGASARAGKFSPWVCEIRSGLPTIRIPRARGSSSTTSVRAPGKRLTVA